MLGVVSSAASCAGFVDMNGCVVLTNHNWCVSLVADCMVGMVLVMIGVAICTIAPKPDS